MRGRYSAAEKASEAAATATAEAVVATVEGVVPMAPAGELAAVAAAIAAPAAAVVSAVVGAPGFELRGLSQPEAEAYVRQQGRARLPLGRLERRQARRLSWPHPRSEECRTRTASA